MSSKDDLEIRLAGGVIVSRPPGGVAIWRVGGKLLPHPRALVEARVILRRRETADARKSK